MSRAFRPTAEQRESVELMISYGEAHRDDRRSAWQRSPSVQFDPHQKVLRVSHFGQPFGFRYKDYRRDGQARYGTMTTLQRCDSRAATSALWRRRRTVQVVKGALHDRGVLLRQPGQFHRDTGAARRLVRAAWASMIIIPEYKEAPACRDSALKPLHTRESAISV